VDTLPNIKLSNNNGGKDVRGGRGEEDLKFLSRFKTDDKIRENVIKGERFDRVNRIMEFLQRE